MKPSPGLATGCSHGSLDPGFAVWDSGYVTGSNAIALLRLLGFDDNAGEDCGVITDVNLFEQRCEHALDLSRSMAALDFSLSMLPLKDRTVSVKIVDLDRRPGYMQDCLNRLHRIALYRAENGNALCFA